jgi:uncharacterized SAM-dependent methyltransferase
VLAGLRDPRSYVAIDIADAFLAETKRIASRFSSLRVRPIERNFLDVFEVPFDGRRRRQDRIFPGLDDGEFEHDRGEDLAYADGATPGRRRTRYHRCRINTELGGDFRLEQFKHVARWNEIEKAVEMYLVSLCDQRVTLCGHTFHFQNVGNHPH